MPAWASSRMGADHELQVSSGLAELPVRVENVTPGPVASHCNRPHRASVVVSCTGDSYDGFAAVELPSNTTVAGLLNPTHTPAAVFSNWFASLSPVSASMTCFRFSVMEKMRPRISVENSSL